MQRRGPADQNDFRTAALGCIGKGIAHFAAGPIAYVAHRVEGLARAARARARKFTWERTAAGVVEVIRELV